MSIAFTLISSLQGTYEAKRKEFLTDLQRKEEEMRQMFVNKVKEAEAELKEKEKEVRRESGAQYARGKVPDLAHISPCLQLHERFEQLKRMHQDEKKTLEEKRRELEEEMNAFNRKKVAAETLIGQAVQGGSQPFKKDKDKKK